MSTAITFGTFGEIEGSTNRTLAYAILVSQVAKNYLLAVYRMRETANALDNLVRILTPERLAALNQEQKRWLTQRLQEIHKLLAGFSRSDEAATLAGLPLLNSLTSRLQDCTEDLDDVIEDLVLVSDNEFQSLIAACAASIELPLGDTFAGMQGR